MQLCNPQVVRSLLEKYSLAPKKAFGQNFLINPMVPERIADASASFADADKPAGVIEIGPGVGALTQYLCQTYDKVVAIEIDRGLIPLLEETLGEYENVRVINEDFMETELTELLHENFGDARPAVCANLPYYITTPIIMKLLEDCPYSCGLPYTSITVMVQFEVADRIAAKQGSADYGAITAAVGLRCSVKKVLTVSPGSFYPPPKVTSAVIQLVPHEKGIYSVYENAPEDREECESFGRRVSELVGAAFSMRRKTLVNALASVYPKEKTLTALESLGMRADIRGERLSSRDFCALADILEKI